MDDAVNRVMPSGRAVVRKLASLNGRLYELQELHEVEIQSIAEANGYRFGVDVIRRWTGMVMHLDRTDNVVTARTIDETCPHYCEIHQSRLNPEMEKTDE